jgi:hypothetical protein
MKKCVLILCTGNSARNQMAEGLLGHDAGDSFEVESASQRSLAVIWERCNFLICFNFPSEALPERLYSLEILQAPWLVTFPG